MNYPALHHLEPIAEGSDFVTVDLALWLFDDDPASAALCHHYFGA